MYVRKQREKWRCEIERNGVRASATFDTKADATQWGIKEEAAILATKRGVFPKRTMAEAADKYVEKVSKDSPGERWEALRIKAFKANFPLLAKKILSTITTADLAEWRDKRLESVSKSTVQREINLLSHVFTKARAEWKWMGDSPFNGMEAPGENPPRRRRPTPRENRRILRWLGYVTGEQPKTKQAEVAFAYLLALRTAMRSGEVLQLSPKTVRGSEATVRHKMQYRTGEPRRVPLSKHALRLLKGFKGFTVTDESRDALFRKAVASCLIEDLHFHDARRDALTRFSKKVDVWELSKISGIKDLRILLKHYYGATSEEIGARL